MANMNSRSQFELNDDNNFETFNFRLENRTSDPAGGMLGSAYFNTVLNCVRVKDSIGWVSYGPKGNPVPYLYNCRPLLFQALNRASGDWDLGAVPTGKKWLVVGAWYSNATAGTIVATPKMFKGGKTVVAGAPVSVLTNTINAVQTTIHPILEAGDVLRWTLDVIGLDINVQVWEFDSISPVKSYYQTALTAGNTTLYTCPTGVKAYPISFTLGQPAPGTLSTSFIYSNSTGGSRTIYGNLVKSGGSPMAPGVGSNCLRPTSTVVVTGTVQQVQTNSCSACLEPGDYLSINTSGPLATQQAWITVLEL